MASLKRLLYIFIPVFAILLMSHNANAVVKPVIDLNQYDFVGNYSQSFDCNYSDSSLNKTDVYNCPLTEGVYLRNIFANQRFNLKKGDIITFDIVIYSNDNFALTFNLKNYYWAVPVQFDVLDIDILDNNYYHQYWAEDSLLPDGYAVNQVWRFTVRANTDYNNSVIGFGQANRNSFTFTANNIQGVTISFILRNITIWRYVGSSENAEQEQATQDAADNASSSGSSSEASAEVATSSLISVIGGFVNVLTTATPTNCKINANLNHIDMGQLDLCANPVPSYIQIIGSIILICAAIPLAIVLFNRFIGLFRSFQG